MQNLADPLEGQVMVPPPPQIPPPSSVTRVTLLAVWHGLRSDRSTGRALRPDPGPADPIR
eukprot:768739-Hanusia_phi.AAC.7